MNTTKLRCMKTDSVFFRPTGLDNASFKFQLSRQEAAPLAECDGVTARVTAVSPAFACFRGTSGCKICVIKSEVYTYFVAKCVVLIYRTLHTNMLPVRSVELDLSHKVAYGNLLGYHY